MGPAGAFKAVSGQFARARFPKTPAAIKALAGPFSWLGERFRTRPRIKAVLMTLIGALILMSATLAIGRPSVFTDTDDYYAQGRSVVRALDKWFFHGVPILNWEDAQYRMTHADGGDEEPVHNQDGARSAYYGVSLYILETVGTLWLFAFTQALTAAGLVYAFWRAAAPKAVEWTYFALMGGLAAASTLPVFTGFAMPDVFAGFAAISTILLMVYPDRFRWPAQATLWFLLAAAMNFHMSNLITSMGLTAASIAALVWFKAPWSDLFKRALTVLLAAVVAISASTVYAKMVQWRSGDELGHPPFLTARVLADGPGRKYLLHACRTGSPYVVCGFKWLPLDDSEDILWSDDTDRGIFNLSEFPVRVQMEHEDAKFALASTLYDPVGQIKVSLDNWRQQIFNTRLDEPLLNPGYYLHDQYWKTTNLPKLIKSTGGYCGQTPGNCAPRVDAETLALIDGVIAFLAAGYVGFRLYRLNFLAMWKRRDFDDPVFRASIAAVLLLTAVLLNAAVCGAISGPFPRYQARIEWLFTASAILFEIAVRSAPRRRAHLKLVESSVDSV
jgi:hypothetical protein